MGRSARLVLVLAACAGCDLHAEGEPPARGRLNAWVEDLHAQELDALVSFASANDLTLHWSIVQGASAWDDVARICRAAAAQEVPLRLWPQLPEAQGYWANQANAGVFAAWVDEIRAWTPAHCPELLGFVVDMEYPYQRAMALVELLSDDAPIDQVLTHLLAGMDERAFDAARSELAALVDRVHADGYEIHVSTPPMVADDWADGDETLAMMFWTPLDGIDWDFWSFQVYRTLYDTQFAALGGIDGQRFPAGLVASYAATIATRYGTRGGVDLGTTRAALGIEHGLAGADELQADVAAALDAGIPRDHVSVYSLEGVLEQEDPARWVAVPAPRSAEIPESVTRVRGVFTLLDAIDDR